MSYHQQRSATAIAHPNIALVKYWGKRDITLNLPAVGSISITLDTIYTQTSVSFDAALTQDVFLLNGTAPTPAISQKVRRFLDAVRNLMAEPCFAHVNSSNNFPTGAGLASSASGFAALAKAATCAANIAMHDQALSRLARLGSGSAARSVLGGFVEMHRGTQSNGSDAYATALLDATSFPLSVVIAITSYDTKAVDSTTGMEQSRTSSPFYEPWLASQEHDLHVARTAIMQRNFVTLADIAEHSCLKMHALAMATQPPLLYWNSVTLAVIHTIMALRRRGVPVFFTVDAGPQVKAVCSKDATQEVYAALQAVPYVQELLIVGLGPGVQEKLL